MSNYLRKLNPWTGRLQWVLNASLLKIKGTVATKNNLPLTDNMENDCYIVKDVDRLYTWGIASPSGTIDDWKDVGSTASVEWSVIENKPSSSVVNIDDAVDKKHEHSNKALLDTYTQTEVDIADAISKEHTHSNKSELDLVTDGDHDIRTDNPHTVTKAQLSLDNVTNNAQVKKASSSTDDYLPKWKGTSGDELEDSSISESDVSDAVSKKHTQNTDNTIEITEAPSSDHTATGMKCDFTAGENVAFGDVCYFKSDGKMWKADADAESTSYCMALALETITADSSGSFLLIGIARDDTWDWTVGSPIYLSTTAGAMTQTPPSGSGDIVQILGIAIHADRIYFKPDFVQVEIA